MTCDYLYGAPEFEEREAARQLRWDRRFLALARHVATWSKDPSSQMGCVIVDPETQRVLSLGYNGFPCGVDDSPERYADRALKYRLVAHADLNAIYSACRAGLQLAGATMYLTSVPCNECMKGIIQVGITRVAWPLRNKFEDDPAARERWKDAIEATMLMAAEAGVTLERVEEEAAGVGAAHAQEGGAGSQQP